MGHDVGSLLDACLAARPEQPKKTYLFCCHCCKRTMERTSGEWVCDHCDRKPGPGVTLLEHKAE